MSSHDFQELFEEADDTGIHAVIEAALDWWVERHPKDDAERKLMYTLIVAFPSMVPTNEDCGCGCACSAAGPGEPCTCSKDCDECLTKDGKAAIVREAQDWLQEHAAS